MVVALADRDLARCQVVADRFGIRGRFADLGTLLDRCPVDVVGVLVPPAEHLAVAREALERGVAVLVEKPLALSLDEADRFVEAAGASSVPTMMGFPMRWHSLVRRVREIVRGGSLGRLESIHALWNSPRDDENLPAWRSHRPRGGGALIELAVHHFDLWRFLLDTEVVEVHARSHHGSRDDEAAVVTALLANGMLASASFSERTSHGMEIDVRGDRGRLRMSGQRFDGLRTFAIQETDGGVRPRLRHLRDAIFDLPRGLAHMRWLGDYGDSYRAEWQHFVDAIRSGSAPECTFEDGRAALRIALAAAASATRGEPVAVQAAPRTIVAARSPK